MVLLDICFRYKENILADSILQLVKNEYEEKIQQFLDVNPSFKRTPQTNTFNVKYYGGTPSSFSEIRPLIISDLNNFDNFSLYLHYPFCRYICDYCHYPVKKITTEDKNSDIINSLIKHYKILTDEFPILLDRGIYSFYLGGGTPSLLSFEELIYLKEHLLNNLKFNEGAELTIEATPDSLNDDKIEILLEIGFNRISVGIQILDNETLMKVRRDHNLEQALLIIDRLKKYPQLKSNVDLIYGLPGVSSEKFLSDTNTIANSGVDSITLYRLRLGRIDERKAVLFSDYTQNPGKYPTQEDTIMQNICSRQILEELGFREEPLGWFNRSDETNQCYKDRWLKQAPMFGLGLSAYSYGSNWQFLNKKNLSNLFSDLEYSIIPFEEGIRLEKEDTLLRKCAFNLRYQGFWELKEINGEEKKILENICKNLIDLELASEKNKVFLLNDMGKAFIDEIIDNYFQKIKSFYSDDY